MPYCLVPGDRYYRYQKGMEQHGTWWNSLRMGVSYCLIGCLATWATWATWKLWSPGDSTQHERAKICSLDDHSTLETIVVVKFNNQSHCTKWTKLLFFVLSRHQTRSPCKHHGKPQHIHFCWMDWGFFSCQSNYHATSVYGYKQFQLLGWALPCQQAR